MGRNLGNDLAFATFIDHRNFSEVHKIYLQIEDKKRFLQCLFFEVLLDQALYTAGFASKTSRGCLYGSVKVVHILAAAGAMVDPYFLLLAASRWAEDSDGADADFTQLCWLFEREGRRMLKGLEKDYGNEPKTPSYPGWAEWPLVGHALDRRDFGQRDLARLMRFRGDVGSLLQTGYFYHRKDLAKHNVFSNWIDIIHRTIAAVE